MRTKQFICLAARQSFRNLIEQYMELKEKEKNANIKEINHIILPGYMNINPRDKAELLHTSQVVNYRYPVVIGMIYDDLEISHGLTTIHLAAFLLRYMKYVLNCIKNCLLGIFGNSWNKL